MNQAILRHKNTLQSKKNDIKELLITFFDYFCMLVSLMENSKCYKGRCELARPEVEPEPLINE